MDTEDTADASISVNSFKVFLKSEWKTHKKVNEKNIKATEDKVRMIKNYLHSCPAKVSNYVDELKMLGEEWLRLQQTQTEETVKLHEDAAKVKRLQKEVVYLKRRLTELEKEKRTVEKANNEALQEKKDHLIMIEQVIKVYSHLFSMDLVVEELEEENICCKVCFRQKPDCFMLFKINRNKKKVTSFSTIGLSATEDNCLKCRFQEHENVLQLLMDFRRAVLKV